MLFLYNRTNIRRQAFTSLQHGFLRSEENVVLYNLRHPKGVWENVMTNNIFAFCFCKKHFYIFVTLFIIYHTITTLKTYDFNVTIQYIFTPRL